MCTVIHSPVELRDIVGGQIEAKGHINNPRMGFDPKCVETIIRAVYHHYFYTHQKQGNSLLNSLDDKV